LWFGKIIGKEINGIFNDMSIKTILFDFGGVILKTPNLRWARRWQKLFGLQDHPEIAEMLANPNDSQLVKDICLGKISEDDVWETVSEKWPIKPETFQRIRRRFFSKRKLNQKLIKFMGELQTDYQVAILSNAGDRTRQVLVEDYHLDRYVEAIIISAEEGVIKPDPRIYQIAMDRLRANPENTLFLDDSLENVLAGREFGFQAVQFIDNHQAIQAMKNILQKET
jgi:putative hydrolase of the HAD superfamily